MRRPPAKRARLRKLALLGTAFVFAQLLGACGSSISPTSSTAATVTATTASHSPSPVPHLSHIVVVVMENEELDGIIGNSAAPYINHLANEGALATASYAVTHPSLPNYLALTGGSTFGIEEDCTDCNVGASRNLIDDLEDAHISWKAYMEDMPRPCFTGASYGLYAKKHDPFLYYDDIRSNPQRCSHVVPATQLTSDLAGGALPQFAWITPNLCNDMHNCSVATGDRYLSGLMPSLIASVGRNGVVFVTWDEGSSNASCCSLAKGGHITTIAAGGAATPHARPAVPYDHYSLLRTIEDSWALPELGYSHCSCTQPMSALLRSR